MLNELQPVYGARHAKKRLGRGIGSGTGKTAGKGSKGQNARTSGGVRPGFEGGQLPLFQRLPKRGFKNVNRKEYAIINLSDLLLFEEGSVIDLAALRSKGLVNKVYDGVKVLGNLKEAEKFNKKYTVKASKFSQSAKEAIEKAGGSVEVL
jgi:large subunit ribosomal protein L15